MKERSQDGYALLVVLLVFSVLMLTLAKAIPDWKTSIQREREAREIDHAREYRTAIRRYFHKYGRYPPSIDAMVQKDGQGLRYLREAWPDPLSQTAASNSDAGSDNSDSGGWQILHYGQADNAKIVDQPPQAALNTTGGQSPIAGPGLSGGTPGGPPAGLGAGTGGPGSPGGPGGVGGAGSTGVSGSGLGTPGNSVGGGPVIGVASSSKTPGVHEFNGFSSPNDWQFVYNYAQDPTLRVTGGAPGSGSGLGGGSGAGTGNPGAGSGGPGTIVH